MESNLSRTNIDKEGVDRSGPDPKGIVSAGAALKRKYSKKNPLINRPMLMERVSREEVLGRIMTPRQQEVFQVIDMFWQKMGYGPSVDEIMICLNAKSRNNVTRMINRLVQVGALKKVPGLARSVRPVDVNFRHIVYED